MVKVLGLALGLAFPGLALACGGADCPMHHGGQTAGGDCPMHHEVAAADTKAPAADPAGCAKKADLVGSGCSYTTGMMAQRVLSEGTPWTFAGSLVSAQTELDSRVAAPFTAGPGIRVVANEVLEQLVSANATGGRLSLEGKLLEVDGVRYFVLTSYASLNS